jgi:hypothetical protein
VKKGFLLLAAGGVIFGGIYAAFALMQGPSDMPGCVYNATPPTLTDGQPSVLQCDTNSKIVVH